MIEQKGPGLPQAACRRLSSSIYLQACAPALPPVWQACPGPSSLPSSLHLSPALSPLPPRLLCSVHWFLFLCLCAYDLYLWVFLFYSKTVCVLLLCPFVFVHDSECCWLFAVHVALWENGVTAWHILLKTEQGGPDINLSGQVFSLLGFFLGSVSRIALWLIAEWFNLCFLFLMSPHNGPHSLSFCLPWAVLCSSLSALSSGEVYQDKTKQLEPSAPLLLWLALTCGWPFWLECCALFSAAFHKVHWRYAVKRQGWM